MGEIKGEMKYKGLLSAFGEISKCWYLKQTIPQQDAGYRNSEYSIQ